MTIDLHGYHPSDIVWCDVLQRILQQAWEIGEADVLLIHGHGRSRAFTPYFVNTNTGFFGLEIRRALRQNRSLRRWIHHTTIGCSNMGLTSVRLKNNPAPSRCEFDMDLIPDALITYSAASRGNANFWPAEV